ncbi:MAG: hypothetical protein H6Q90_2232 [Deltaproteobacteria bacterium]|nr:hypothetical protein [Deltaproteobacteria bacterium]
MAWKVNKGLSMSNHLQTIVTRQRSSRVRDAIFAGFVALAAVISVTTVTTAAHAASSRVVGR